MKVVRVLSRFMRRKLWIAVVGVTLLAPLMLFAVDTGHADAGRCFAYTGTRTNGSGVTPQIRCMAHSGVGGCTFYPGIGYESSWRYCD